VGLFVLETHLFVLSLLLHHEGACSTTGSALFCSKQKNATRKHPEINEGNMALRLIKIGSSGFNLDAVAGWRYQAHPEFPNDRALYLYLSLVLRTAVFRAVRSGCIGAITNSLSTKDCSSKR
jgi:hypothetical protein